MCILRRFVHTAPSAGQGCQTLDGGENSRPKERTAEDSCSRRLGAHTMGRNATLGFLVSRGGLLWTPGSETRHLGGGRARKRGREGSTATYDAESHQSRWSSTHIFRLYTVVCAGHLRVACPCHALSGWGICTHILCTKTVCTKFAVCACAKPSRRRFALMRPAPSARRDVCLVRSRYPVCNYRFAVKALVAL